MKAKEKELLVKDEVLSNSNIKSDWLVASAVDDIYNLEDEG